MKHPEPTAEQRILAARGATMTTATPYPLPFTPAGDVRDASDILPFTPAADARDYYDDLTDAMRDCLNAAAPPARPAPAVRPPSRQQARVLAYITTHPGQQQMTIARALGLQRTSANTALQALCAAGRVSAAGPHFARCYQATGQEERA
jgi:hypothetical protein